jgi:TolB-like protein
MTYPRVRALGAFGALMVAGCAGAPSTARPAPADIATLEARRAQQPGDPAINLRLAEAYYGAQRYTDARAALATTLMQQPGNAEAQVYLGYTYEGLAQFDSARAVYNALAASKTDRNVRRLISGRLALMTRTEMQYYAKQAIAQESTVTRTPPPSNTVAVMPFRYSGTDSTYRPLERGLAALVVTDLGRVRDLQLVERERLQALLDELKLSDNGRVDPSTGARSGRLVGAASVVQGQFDVTPTQVRVDASVVRASDAGVAATGSGADQLRALFDIEKQVVFQLIDKLGITLTPAERVAISERPTSNLQAFLL